jgi:hypothetical protein
MTISNRRKGDEQQMKLLTLYRVVFLIAVTLGSVTASFSQSNDNPKAAPSEDKTSIEGLVRDVACPIQNHKSTATNFSLECALACAKSGSPLIILTKAGDMYFPISNEMPDLSQREKLIPFVGKYVRATGTVNQRNGTRTIAIKEIKEMPEVKLDKGAFSNE